LVRWRAWPAALFLLGLLGLLAWLSLSQGYLDFAPSEIWTAVRDLLSGRELTSRGLVIAEVRLPRLVTASLAGAALGLSGAVFQGLLLNPLADPYTLGVSSGAALGAAAVITLSLAGWPGLAHPLMPAAGAFAGSILTLAAVMALAREKDGSLPPANLILAGVIVSAILSAGLSFLKYLAGDQVSSLIFWLLGSFLARTWTEAGIVALFLGPALAVSLFRALDLNIMTLGLREARTLGVAAVRVRRELLIAASLAASAAVAVAGIIGFVGLIVPHLLRLLIGPDHRILLPLSALGGAVLLAAADWAVRILLPGEIPVGVLTALLAGPVFLVIFRRRMRDLARG
jgi:iron complex transport system permease protein